MTHEKAYEECKEFFDNDGIGELDVVAFNMALNALRKQIPKKPTFRKGTTYSFCPNCGSDQIHDYCGTCGQKIDWSDVDKWVEELQMEGELK
jgi:hypothetical protein